MHCLFFLFAIVLGQQSSEDQNQDLQFGELLFTESQSQDVNATRMKINFNIEAFQNWTSANPASEAMNQVMTVVVAVKDRLRQHQSIEKITTTEMKVWQDHCGVDFNKCPPLPTRAPVPVQPTNTPAPNETQTPTEPPAPGEPNNATGATNATGGEDDGYRCQMGISFETNISNGQQLIEELLGLGTPWLTLDGISFTASDDELSAARDTAIELCLSNLRQQAETMLNKLEVCFVDWRRVKIIEEEYKPLPIFVVNNWTSFSLSDFQAENPLESDQNIKVSVSAIARFEACEGGSQPTDTPAPTGTPAPTDTPAPTGTPTDTPAPTGTPAPTDTPAPTGTPAPTNIPSDPPTTTDPPQ